MDSTPKYVSHADSAELHPSSGRDQLCSARASGTWNLAMMDKSVRIPPLKHRVVDSKVRRLFIDICQLLT